MSWINPEIIKIRKNNGTKTTSNAGHRHVSEFFKEKSETYKIKPEIIHVEDKLK